MCESNKQLIKTTLKNGVTKDNGPYYVLTEKDSNKKTLTESVPKEKLDFYYKEIEKYKTYVALTKRYEELSIEASRILSDGSHGDDKLKKNRTLK
ncbi:MAG: hypothetical protein FWH01_13265 [Oscillospiraceae bacterium]|nr:hypothetical protein [Oscillospiraceae bacterium]